MEKIVLVGAGGHAKTIVDTIERNECYEIIGFIDKEHVGKEVYRSYRVIGQDEYLKKLFALGIHHAVLSIGYMGKGELRDDLYALLKSIGYNLPVIVDATAVVSKGASIGEGTYVGRNAVVNASAQIGKMCIINTAAVVEHECVVGDYSHIAVGAVMCGQAKLGSHVLLGSNATVVQQCEVGEFAIIGAGATVVDNLPAYCTAVGTPAKIIESNG